MNPLWATCIVAYVYLQLAPFLERHVDIMSCTSRISSPELRNKQMAYTTSHKYNNNTLGNGSTAASRTFFIHGKVYKKKENHPISFYDSSQTWNDLKSGNGYQEENMFFFNYMLVLKCVTYVQCFPYNFCSSKFRIFFFFHPTLGAFEIMEFLPTEAFVLIVLGCG